MPSLTIPLPRTVERYVAGRPARREAAVDAAVRLLRGRSSSWPVDTGRSKRAWRRAGSGDTARVFNPLHYAVYVEAKNGRPARATLRRGTRTIMTAARTATPATPSELAAEGLTEVVRAAAARERLEEQFELYQRYRERREQAGRRAPLVPARFRRIDRLIRRLASVGA